MTDTKELDIREIAGILGKRIWAIILSAILAAALALGYTFAFVEPMYQANVTMYVNNRTSENGNGITSNDLAVALRLVTTYVNILKSDSVLEKVIAETKLDLQIQEVRSMLTAEAVEDTEMFVVRITTDNPRKAATIANAVAAVAPEEISAIIDGSSAKIIDYAKIPTQRHSPSYPLNIILGAGVGFVLAAVAIILQAVLNVRVRGEEDLQKICDIPVIGMIPDLADEVNGKDKKKNMWRR